MRFIQAWLLEFNLRKPQKLYLPLDGPAYHKFISGFTTELINSDGLDNHAHVNFRVDGWKGQRIGLMAAGRAKN